MDWLVISKTTTVVHGVIIECRGGGAQTLGGTLQSGFLSAGGRPAATGLSVSSTQEQPPSGGRHSLSKMSYGCVHVVSPVVCDAALLLHSTAWSDCSYTHTHTLTHAVTGHFQFILSSVFFSSLELYIFVLEGVMHLGGQIM